MNFEGKKKRQKILELHKNFQKKANIAATRKI